MLWNSCFQTFWSLDFQKLLKIPKELLIYMSIYLYSKAPILLIRRVAESFAIKTPLRKPWYQHSFKLKLNLSTSGIKGHLKHPAVRPSRQMPPSSHLSIPKAEQVQGKSLWAASSFTTYHSLPLIPIPRHLSSLLHIHASHLQRPR